MSEPLLKNSADCERKRFSRRINPQIHKIRATEMRRKKRKEEKSENELIRLQILKSLNQLETKDEIKFPGPSSPLNDDKLQKAINEFRKNYSEDVKIFLKSTRKTNVEQCSVCGSYLDISTVSKHFSAAVSDKLFSPLCHNGLDWFGYFENSSRFNGIVDVCNRCFVILKKNKIPPLSRVNVPIHDGNMILDNLTDIEALLISPILPITYIWRHNYYGQYKGKSQTIAVKNDILTLAKEIPRLPKDVVIEVEGYFGWKEKVRVDMLRKAFYILKNETKHPYFLNIPFSEKNASEIEKMIAEDYEKESNNSSNSIHGTNMRDFGLNQFMEPEVSEKVVEIPMGHVEDSYDPMKVTRSLVTSLINAKRGKGEIHKFSAITDGWHLVFPTLLPDGKGGPEGLYERVSLNEWLSYVMKIKGKKFNSNIIFIFYSNSIVRRLKISGVCASKPVSKRVSEAVSALYEELETGNFSNISDEALSSLVSQLSFYNVQLPGSIEDMYKFRKDIFTMISEFGPPTFFVTLSSADTIWPEMFTQTLNGEINIEEARKLTSLERAEIVCRNSGIVTLLWKKRLDSFINLICNGKSQLLGQVTHYCFKSEWQSRGSEHAHILVWSDNSVPRANFCFENPSIISNKEEIISKVESFIGASIPSSSEGEFLSKSLKVSAIQNEPIQNISDFFVEDTRKNIQYLIQSTQRHVCSKYCTKNYSKSCKSQFPFPKQRLTTLHCRSDKMGTKQYRVRLRRSDSWINPYNLLILNLWRANMDITPVISEPFGAAVYIAMYTSKVEKYSDFSEIRKKLRRIGSTSETRFKLRKILLAIEGARTISASEAVSNVMKFPHWKTTCHIVRISTLPYMSYLKKKTDEGIGLNEKTILTDIKHDDRTIISDLFPKIIADVGIEENTEIDFEIRNNNHRMKNNNREDKVSPTFPRYDIATIQYHRRPRELEGFSHKEYSQKWRVSRKRKASKKVSNDEFIDLDGNVVVMRERGINKDIILDLKYRVSPLNSNDDEWCVGPLVLHVPHRLPEHLLHEFNSYVDSFNYFQNLVDENGDRVYKGLWKTENEEMKLHTTRSRNHNLSNKDKFPDNDKYCEEGLEDDTIEEQENFCDEVRVPDIDKDNPDIYNSLNHVCNSVMYEDSIRWSGKLQRTHLTSENDSHNLNIPEQDIEEVEDSRLIEALSVHKIFIEKICREPFNDLDKKKYDKHEFAHFSNSNIFLEKVLDLCRTEEQKVSFKKIISRIGTYYFSPCDSSHVCKRIPPLIAVVGVPGAGKSWLINNVREWVKIRIPADHRDTFNFSKCPIHDTEYLDSVSTSLLNPLITSEDKPCYGKAPAMAYSGAAAGIVNGYTIHRMLCFARGDLSNAVMRGEKKLPSLSVKKREELLILFREVKLLVIDEIFSIQASMFYLISERLKQIYQVDENFGGIPVIIVGDPRQIIPVSGRPLFHATKYVPFPGDICEIRKSKETNSEFDRISVADYRGFELYSLFKNCVVLSKSVRMVDEDYSRLNSKVSTYRLQLADIPRLNKFYRSHAELYSTPWIDSVWMFATWDLVNEHLLKVLRVMGRKRGICRVWSSLQCSGKVSMNSKFETFKKYYDLHVPVSQSFDYPHSHFDFFPGQIVNLKHNFNPILQLHNNAKFIVLSVTFNAHDKNIIRPNSTVNEAIHHCCTYRQADIPDVIVRPYIGRFDGPSALPHIPGLLALPKTPNKIVRINNINIKVRCHYIHPANAVSCHQSQGATYTRSVACINNSTESYYGMANVVTSRTPQPENFSLFNTVTLPRMMPKPNVSSIVEKEYGRLSGLSDW